MPILPSSAVSRRGVALWALLVAGSILTGPVFAQKRAVDLLCETDDAPREVDTYVGPRIHDALKKTRQPGLPRRNTRGSDVPPVAVPAGEVDPAQIPGIPQTARERFIAMQAAGAADRSRGAPDRPRAARWVDPVVERLFPALTRASYTGDARCLECHETKKDDWRRSVYGLIHYDRSLPSQRRGCEGCHGPGGEHVQSGSIDWIVNPAKLDRRPLDQVCLSCHTEERMVRRQGWQFSRHREGLVGCLDCHSIHSPRSGRALVDQVNRLCFQCHRDQESFFSMTSRHPVKVERVDAARSTADSKVRCIDCHAPHSAENPRLIRSDRSQSCLKCHPEFRGPFLFQHGALDVLADGCMTCHLPHGSPNRSLFVRPDRALCITCHTDRMAHGGGQTCFSAAGCHNEIHGSNKNRLLIGSMGLAPASVGPGGPWSSGW